MTKSLALAGVHVRWMISRDFPELAAVDAASFSDPMGEEWFREQLRQRNVIGFVAEAGELVVGYVLYEMLDDSLRIRSMAVLPGWRRQGVAAGLVAKLKKKLHAKRRNTLYALVVEENLEAQLFLRAQGLGAIAIDREQRAYEMAYVVGIEDTAEQDAHHEPV